MTETTAAVRLARLSDDEKIALTAGADAWSTTAVERLGIPALRLGDGPHGVRRPNEGAAMSLFDSHPATCFPTAATLGATWDPALVREIGVALGREAAAHGLHVLLGPGVNLKRTPVGGRNFEYFSEDPLVSSRLGAAWVGGVQSTGVGASLKHLAANNTEQRRYGIDAVVDERALRELYLACFERIVIDERPATVMAAYNKLNGAHCTENPWLLTELLREDWGFDGVVVSDWGASWDRRLSIPAGTDLTMPGFGAGDDRYVRTGLADGALPRDALDASVRRILELVDRHAGVTVGAADPDLDAHHDLARRAAAAGTVLLKNDGLLPLAPGARLALIGALADEPRYQGAGSSHVVPTRIDTLRSSLCALTAPDAPEIVYAPGYDTAHHTSTPAQLAEAREAARTADVAIVVVGLPETYETEGVDRDHLRLPAAHDRLVEAVREVNPNTVVVLQNGSPVELPWHDSVPAIVESYLGGQAGGSALAAVLCGDAEPGGRLAETFPLAYADHPVAALPNGPATAEYRESLYVGYRYADSVGTEVAFPFGHGLSYTSFEWSDAVVTVTGETALVRLTVTNIGDRAGSEVVQLYLHDPESALFRPEQELRAFAKSTLAPGDSEQVTLALDARAFSYWSPAARGWVLEPGRFDVRLGRSSRDILWRTTITVPEGASDSPDGFVAAEAAVAAEPLAYRSPSLGTGFPAADFERLLGRPLPPDVPARPGRFTLDTALRDMGQTLAGRLLLRYVHSQAVATLGAPATGPVHEAAGDVVAQLTFRLLPTVSEGVVTRRRAVFLLGVVNLLAWPHRVVALSRPNRGSDRGRERGRDRGRRRRR